MHHALELDEILLNIFAHCNPPRFKNSKHGRPLGAAAALVALARTCRIFKEPALDVLWSELSDLSPLARCLPEVSFQITPGFKVRHPGYPSRTFRCEHLFHRDMKWYSFSRPLERAEWLTLRSYTRRVRSILDFGSAFHADCVRTFLSPSTPEPLFPNLRYLRCIFANETAPLLLQPLPLLISLDYSFIFEGNLSLFQDSLDSFPEFSPRMRKLSIRVRQPEVVFDKVVSDYICRWSNPQIVYCPQITLGVGALVHLSHMPGLTQLSFALSATLPDEITPSNTSLFFWNLQELKLFSESLIAISNLLARIRLPTVTDFSVKFGGCPSKGNVTSFLTALETSSVGDSIMGLELIQMRPSSALPDPLVLASDVLRPSRAFRNLRRINLSLTWKVGLTDNDLLELASVWPHLEHLLINEKWGWRTWGGITPDGLVRLLQTCRSLSRISLVIDTRAYIEVPPARSPASLGLDPPSPFAINVIDSVIEWASVPAMAAFLASIVPSAKFSFSAWQSRILVMRPDKAVYAERWNEVHTMAEEAVARRSQV